MKIFEHVFLSMCLILVKLGNIKGMKRNSSSSFPRNLCLQNLRYELPDLTIKMFSSKPLYKE